MFRSAPRVLLLAGAVVAAAACGDKSPTAVPPPPPAITLLAGAGLADTVDATPATLLRVAVRGPDGKPAANTVVRAIAMGVPSLPLEREVLVGPAGGSSFGSLASASTDAQGTVEFRVKLGHHAGPGRVIVDVPSLSLVDTARYTIQPGAVGRVRSLPEDTTVLIGGRAPLRLATFDRYGNALADAATLTATAGPGSLAGNEVVAGASIGQITVVATAGAASDTTYVRVAPPGRVAAVSTALHSGQAAAIYTFSLDGTQVRRVRTSAAGNGYFGEMTLGGWLSPSRLVYHDNNWNHTKQVYVLDVETGASARFLPQADQMEAEYFPRVSRDRSWVYFSGGTYSEFSMFRARADGTGKEAVSSSASAGRNEWGADPSPDGARVVFGTPNANLFVMDLATRHARLLSLSGWSPRWSPDGSRIAYLARPPGSDYHRLTLVSPDGSGERRLTDTYFVGDVDWSPDGRYIIGVTGFNQLAILEVATGAEVAVPVPGIDGDLGTPVWRP